MKVRGPMKIILLLLAVLGCTVAVPNGYYHQEYNYKTSSSSFKNNELQHKTDDQGYYRKDGDLDGRVKPVVDANSEHSEYVNPNSQSGQYYGGADADFSSTGNMRAQSGYNGYGSNTLDAEGIARSDRIIGSTGYSSGSNTDYLSTRNTRTSGYNGYGSHTLDAERLDQSGRLIGNTGYSSGYGSNSIGSNSQSYGISNLRLITSRVQQELESDLQEAVRQNNIYPQTRVDISQLERELKQNLTERLNNELIAKFGQQMVRGGMSYTITDGRLQLTANYNNEELSNLKRQLENSLINQLRTQYSSSSSSNSQYYNSQGSYGYSTTVRPVYNSIYPSLPSYTSTARYPVDYNNANYQTVRYTPITNPQSITNIASRVQNQLDTRLNEVLDETYRKYFSSDSSYSLTNTDVLLERIRNELRSNLTYLLNDDIRNNYGTQIQRDGYYYSVGPTGQTSTDYNYSSRDLENLKQQVERNLIEKLNRDFETHRSSWSSHQSYNSQSSYGSNYQYSSTPRYYEVVTTPRRSYVNPYSNSASQVGYVKTGSSASNQYDYATGSQQSGYGIQSSGSIAQLQRQLQDDLSRQLRGALSTGHYSSYSSSGAYNPQNYQTTLQQLSDELNRNLTRQLQEYSAMGSYAAYGNFDSAQMQRLKTQLQDSLMSQLQQGLQKSYQSSSSYSSSSSSSSNSNYRPVRGYQNYEGGQYRSGLETVAGEDCAGDDPNAYSNVRAKRSSRFLNINGLQLDLNQGNRGSSHHVQRPTELGQELDDYDSTQQIEESGFGSSSNYGQGHDELGQFAEYKSRGFSQGHDQTEVGQQIDENDDYENGKLQVSHLGQQVDESDLTQQVEDSHYGKMQVSDQGQHIYNSDEDSGYGKLQVSNQGQQVDNSYLTQQVEDSDYRKLQFSNQGQQVDNSDSIPQVQDSGKLQVSNQGQYVDDADLTQQVEDSGYGSNHGREVDHSYLTQQVEDSDYRNLQFSNQDQQVDNSHSIPQVQNLGKLQVSNQGQYVDDADLTQQVEDSGYGQHISNQGGLVDNSYLTQQVEDSDYGKLQFSNQGQQVDNSDSIPQVQNSGYEKLLVSNQGQQVDDLESTQQVEDSGYGKLQIPNQGQQVDNSYLTQHVEDSDYRKLEFSNQDQQVDLDSIPQVHDSGKLQVSNQGQYVDDADLTQQVEDSGYGQQISNQGQLVDNPYLTQQVEDSDYRKLQFSNQGQQVDNSDSIPQVLDSSKLQISNQGQHVDDTDLTQQVEDSGYGKQQLSSQSQLVDNPNLTEQVEDSDHRRWQVSTQGQQVDDSGSIPQDSNYEKLRVSNQGQHFDDSDLTQQVEYSGYGKPPLSSQSLLVTSSGEQTDSYRSNQEQQVDDSGFDDINSQHPIETGQQIDNSDYPYAKFNVRNQTHQTDSVPEKYEVPHQGQGVESGQQVDDSELVQQVVDHPGVGPNHPQYFRELKPEIEDSHNRNDVGQPPQSVDLTQHIQQLQNPEVPEQGQISEFGQQVIDKRPIEAEQGPGQQTEKQGFVTIEQERVVPQNEDRIPNNQLEVTTVNPDLVNEYVKIEKWCSTYIDTSLMDAPWTLSNQLEEEINNEYHLLAEGARESQKDILYQKILAKLPKYIIYTCFNVNSTKLSNREKDELVVRLESYFKSLIKRNIDEVVQDDKNNRHNLLQQPEKVEITTVNASDSEYEYVKIEKWCSKYIDTSLMDAPWTLSNQLEEEINREYHLLSNGVRESQKDNLYQKIWAKLPKNIMYICFHVDSMKLSKQEEDEEVVGLEDYFKSLIKRKIDDVVQDDKNNKHNLLQQPEKVEVTENEIHLNQELEDSLRQQEIKSSYESIEDWCTKYIDTSMMDAPWKLSIQLKNTIAKQCSRTIGEWQLIYRRVLNEIPINITNCFDLQGMSLNEVQLAEKRHDIETYLKSLIKNDIVTVCKLENEYILGQVESNENLPKNEYNPVPLGTLQSGQTTQKLTTGENQFPQTHSTNEIGRPPKINELPTSNQFMETNQKREENLPQPQIINGVINDVNGPQSITPSSSHNSIQPKQSEANAIEITEQGQFLHRPQPLPEAERTADSLINALRNSQTSRHNQKPIDDYPDSYYGYNGYRSHVYENSRPYGQSHGTRYSHYTKYNNVYDNKPIGYNQRPYPGSYGYNTYQTRNSHSHQPPRYNKPLNYGRVEVVEQDLETTSDIEPVRTGHANFVNHVKPVYSGVKGRNRYSGNGYQPALARPGPPQVQVEPVAIQEIVRHDVTAPQAVHETAPLSTENDNLPWWKRYGQKIKQGAVDLKNKIIGV